MRISATNLGVAVAQFLEQEFGTKAQGFDRLLLYMTIPTVSARMPAIIEQHRSILDMFDVIDSEGFIDMEKGFPLLKNAMVKTGTLTVGRFSVNDGDVDKLESIARQYAQS